MENFIFQRWLFAASATMVVTIGFDAILHGLSHSGHGLLDKLWQGETAERNAHPKIFSGIGWHIFADALLAVLISLLITQVGDPGIILVLAVGTLIGGIESVIWAHVYAAFEVGGKIIFTLGLLNFIQVILATMVANLIYWR